MMHDGPVIASVAALMGDPARANMLTALLDGRALTVSELAHAAGVSLPTASGHLSKLDQAALVTAEKQGRHRYFRLSGADVAQTMEALMSLAQRTGAVRVRTGPNDAALRTARVCYDHLAGERAVRLMQSLVDRALIVVDGPIRVTLDGRAAFHRMGVDLDNLERGRRPLCRACLDWSERKSHLGGALGAALLDRILEKGWAARGEGRVIRFSEAGSKALQAAFDSDQGGSTSRAQSAEGT
jgi:DNA-binding transcriptional ArsR family regulator